MLKFLFSLSVALFLFSCQNSMANQKLSDLPSWYVNPKQNDDSYLYGVGEGFTLEESTKSALADMASRLIVSISSQSSLLREENNNSTNEEMRQKINQNIEKIDFANFEVSKSQNIKTKIYTEVKVDKSQFINLQQEKITFLKNQIANLQKNLLEQNIIQKRNSLIKILDLSKQLEILVRIADLSSLNNVLKTISDTQNQLNKMNDKVEFYFEMNSPKAITNIIKNALNKEAISVSNVEKSGSNQIKIKVFSSAKNGQVYGANITKIKINFENISQGKTIASNFIEVSGSSTISEEEAYNAAIISFKEEVEKQGILKILGIN